MALTPIKISELPDGTGSPAASALDGTELVPVVQGGTTYHATADQFAQLARDIPDAAVAAAGTDQAGATLITTGWTNVTSGSGGVRLPSIAGGEMFFVYNGLGTNLNIYPASGQQLSGRTANSPLTLYPNQFGLIIGRASGQAAMIVGSNQSTALQALIGQSGASVVYLDSSNGVNLLFDLGIRLISLFFGSPAGQRAIMDSPSNGQFRFRSILTGDADFRTIFTVTGVLDAVNNLNINPAVAGSPPGVTAAGSDTNIDILLTPKGTGNVRFGTVTGNADAPINGYVTIKDAAGNSVKLATIA